MNCGLNDMSILENNLSGIGRYNPKLASKIREHVFSESSTFELVNAQSEDVNLLYNDISVHDAENPQKEAIQVLNQTHAAADSIIILVGLGLGYLLKRTYLECENKIIIFEPNLDILRFTLEVVDFSVELADKRIFVVHTRTELVKFLEECYSYKAPLNLYALASSSKLCPQELESLKNELPDIHSHLEGNYKCLFEKSYLWAEKGINNLPELINSYSIDSLKDKFKAKPAIIVSPGPSLEKNVEFLKKYRDKIIIFCVANAFKTLIKHGLRPDFVNFVDIHSNSAIIDGIDFSDTYIIAQTFVSNNIYKLNARERFVFYCHNDIVSRWLSTVADFSVENYENKGTVSYSAMYSAYMLGCNPIVLVGQDLAFTNGECYAASSAYGRAYKCIKDEKDGKFKLVMDDFQRLTDYCDPANKVLSDAEFNNMVQYFANFPVTLVKGQNGNMIPTSPDYASFIRYFEEFAYNNTDTSLQLINSSTGGAQIEGFKDMQLDKVLESMPDIEISVKDIVEKSLSDSMDPVRNNSDKIRENLDLLIEDIDKYTSEAKNARNISGQLVKELQKSRMNINFVKNSVNKLINYYYEIKENLFDRHIILLNCVFKELLELNPLLENDECVDSLDGLKRIALLSQNLYDAFLNKVIYLQTIAKISYSELEKK